MNIMDCNKLNFCSNVKCKTNWHNEQYSADFGSSTNERDAFCITCLQLFDENYYKLKHVIIENTQIVIDPADNNLDTTLTGDSNNITNIVCAVDAFRDKIQDVIGLHTDESKRDLMERLNVVEHELNKIDKVFCNLESITEKITKKMYIPFSPKIIQLSPLDLDDVDVESPETVSTLSSVCVDSDLDIEEEVLTETILTPLSLLTVDSPTEASENQSEMIGSTDQDQSVKLQKHHSWNTQQSKNNPQKYGFCVSKTKPRRTRKRRKQLIKKTLKQSTTHHSDENVEESSDTIRDYPKRNLRKHKNLKTNKSEPDSEIDNQIFGKNKPIVPPKGNIPKPSLTVGSSVYVMKSTLSGCWVKGKIVDILMENSEDCNYKVKVNIRSKKKNRTRNLKKRHLAYETPCPVQYPVGTRVIAASDNDKSSIEQYYVGFIAEPPVSSNKYRYLVFFDDGHAKYVSHEKILLVCDSSKEVWRDVDVNSQDFVREYLNGYSVRPMVKLKVNQKVQTEWNGDWWVAKVVEVDASLAKLFFYGDSRSEWIYRGSARLGPLFDEMQRSSEGKSLRRNSQTSLKGKNEPYVEYTTGP